MARTDGANHKPGTACLTLDVEPDYARSQTLMILDRTQPFFQWVREEQVPITTFVTGQLIEQGHPILEQLQSAGISVELHGYSHAVSGFGTMCSSHAEEIQRGTDAYVKRFGRVPTGYRAPSGIVSAEDVRLLDRLGYLYDSSIFPVRRPGRYDFTGLPNRPFRWEGLRLTEFPVALLTSRVPAGLTFTNLLGPRLSAIALARSAPVPPAPVVIDGHFHNMFTEAQALRTLPWRLRVVYSLGRWSGGLSSLRSLIENMRRRGFIFESLTQTAQGIASGQLPAVSMSVFEA